MLFSSFHLNGHTFKTLRIKLNNCSLFRSYRYLTLKQMLPQLEQFESGLEEALNWLEEALVALEAYRNVNTLEEVEKELGRYSVSTLQLVLATVFSSPCPLNIGSYDWLAEL